MYYTQYNKDGKIVTPADLQNKTQWCNDGAKIEEVFIERYGEKLGLQINPDKTLNPYVPDLTNGLILSDLKTQNTPFFKAMKLFRIDPSYAVVFNRKDAERYASKYPNIDIYFWVEWHSVKFVMGSFSQEVEFISGVWKIPFTHLQSILATAPEHKYQQRVNDKRGNAKSSYVLDIRNPLFKQVV